MLRKREEETFEPFLKQETSFFKTLDVQKYLTAITKVKYMKDNDIHFGKKKAR